MSFYVSTATFFLLHCDEWYRVVALPRHKFVTGATLLQLVGRQSAIHTENSGFASPTLGQHISTFRGYQILFSIRNPYINRFTNHFSIHSQPSYPQKVVLHSIAARFCLRSYDSAIFQTFFKHLSQKTTITAMYHGR